MADQNSSGNGKPPMNSISSELARIGANEGRAGANYQNLSNQYNTDKAQLSGLYKIRNERHESGARFGDMMSGDMSGLIESMRVTKGRMNSMNNSVNSRSEVGASRYIDRQMSSATINGQVSNAMRSTSTQNAALGMSSTMSYDDLSTQKNDIYAQIRTNQAAMQQDVRGSYTGRGAFNPATGQKFDAMQSANSGYVQSIANINAAQRMQKAAGKDPESRAAFIGAAAGDASQIIRRAGLDSDFDKRGQNAEVSIGNGSGGNKSVKFGDVNKEMVHQAKELEKALKDLTENAGASAETLKKFRDKAEESADNMKKLKEAQGAGATDGPKFNGANVLNGVSGMFSSIGQAASQIFVGQRMQQTANTGGMANLANQQYDEYKKARGGDVASQLALGNWKNADDFGEEMYQGQKLTKGASLVSNVAGAAANGIQVVNTAKTAGLTLGTLSSGELMTSANGLVANTAGAAVDATDLNRQASTTAARIAGIQQSHEAAKAINAIPAEQMQGMRNMFTDMDTATQGAGSRAGALINEATGTPNLTKMIGARMSPQQFAQMSGQGIESMGSNFDSSQVFAAQNLERKGMGNASTNMQRMATLSQAGGNNPQASLGNVLEVAVAKGLDSSKSIGMMVDHTAAMASGGGAAAMGMDSTGASAAMLAASVNGDMKNKEAALAQAIGASAKTEQQTTDRSATWTGMVNTASLRKATGLSQVDATALQAVSASDLKAVQGDPKAIAKLYANQGINVSEGRAEQINNAAIREKQIQIIRRETTAFGGDAGALVDRSNAGTLSKADKLELGRYSNYGGRQGGAVEVEGQLRSLNAKVPSGGGKDYMADGGGDATKNAAFNLRTSGFAQMSEAAASASKAMEKFGGSLSVLTKLTEKYEKGGVSNEDEFSKSGGEMAKSLVPALNKFSAATSAYEAASHRILDSLKSNRVPYKPKEWDTVQNNSVMKKFGSKVKH
jgi:hypothetical protein